MRHLLFVLAVLCMDYDPAWSQWPFVRGMERLDTTSREDARQIARTWLHQRHEGMRVDTVQENSPSGKLVAIADIQVPRPFFARAGRQDYDIVQVELTFIPNRQYISMSVEPRKINGTARAVPRGIRQRLRTSLLALWTDFQNYAQAQ